MHYSIFDSTVEKYMVTCSRYIVARIFESVVVVAEVYEYPDLLLSLEILITQWLSDRTWSTYLKISIVKMSISQVELFQVWGHLSCKSTR